MKKVIRILTVLVAAWSILPYIRLRAPAGFVLLFPRLLAGALAPVLATIGALSVLTALIRKAPLTVLAGGLGTILSVRYVRQVTLPHAGFAEAFGEHWQHAVPARQRRSMLQRRWTCRMPKRPPPRWTVDIPFWTIPGTNRALLCDIWQPPIGVAPSGVAYLYFHGSGWYILDKDLGTRKLFRHLAAQGHVVMDVAYRLYPEADLAGMLDDVKRAVAWMKDHASAYGVNPARLVVGGSSAGGHLALLAAYTRMLPDLTPDDVRGVDLTVRGVISVYGPADLQACYEHTNQASLAAGKPPDFTAPASRLVRALFGPSYERLGLAKAAVAGRLDWLLGGRPEEVPERYTLFSPLTHVDSACPPTLLIQGEDDLITPVGATLTLADSLRSASVPVVSVVLPHTDHGFDLMLPAYSPPAQSALYNVERFLALMAS